MEEAKTQEIEELQFALQQLQLKESRAIFIVIVFIFICRLESENKLLRQQVEEIKHPPTPATEKNVDALISCVTKNIGFSHGTPIAALTIYKCLLHWKSFEAKRISVFDRLIQIIGSAIEDQDNNHLSYWLSNTSTLLILLQRNLKGAGVNGATPHQKPPPQISLEGMTMGFSSSPSSPNLHVAPHDVVCRVEAKYPALLFEQQLTAHVEKIYGTIRDNLKKELASSLSLCIKAPRTSKGALGSGRPFRKYSPTTCLQSIVKTLITSFNRRKEKFVPRKTMATPGSGQSFGKDSPTTHWQSIIESLNILLNTLKETSVPPILVQKIFSQTFSYINVQLFNSLLLHHECCTFSNGEYLKAGLAELELWCQAKEQFAGSLWDELKHIRQAVGFLVIHKKYRMSYDEITNDICPILSVRQLYRLSILFWDDNKTQNVSPEVLSSMRVLITEDSNDAVSNFLLDDDSSIPFSVDDLSTSLHEKDFSDVKPADELLGNTAFQFLRTSTC